MLTFSQTKTRKPYYGGFISIGSVGKSGPHPLKSLGLVYNLDNSEVSDYSESSEKVYMPENLVGVELSENSYNSDYSKFSVGVELSENSHNSD